uniref:Cointegrase n=2 Tax=Staphylococcaceae TaxID=90964 RepID=V5V1T9_9STAP|nr:cointegrase [Mammaliicoccus lentus]AHB87386.1 cointegrase [Staphylococcus rostri]
MTEEIVERLKGFIQDNEWKRKNNMSKQQMKKIDMYEKLQEEGYDIGYTTVRNFVNSEERRTKEVYIRQRYSAAWEVEFDWGEVKLVIDGKQKSYSLAVFTLAYSNYRFALLYESETMICIQDAHTKLIDHLGFVPSVFTYDNMRTVVKSFVGTDRKITDGMINLSNYYEFRIRLCEPRKGNQKGHVERSVEVVRRFAFPSLEDAQKRLAQTILSLNKRIHHEKKLAHIELKDQEKVAAAQEALPLPFDVSEVVECRVDKYSTVTIKQNRYSVPEGHVGAWIRAKVSADSVRLFIEGEFVAEHRRNWGVHQWEMDLYHYIKTFTKKKGALAQSECLSQAPNQIKKLFENHYIGKEKDFLELLLYVREKNQWDNVMAAVRQIETKGLGDITTEKLIFLSEQTDLVPAVPLHPDETVEQALQNIKAFSAMFNQVDEGVLEHG